MIDGVDEGEFGGWCAGIVGDIDPKKQSNQVAG
jgi:hypothetical protein